MSSVVASSGAAPFARRINPVTPEGTDGLYTQAWYAVCLSSELMDEKPLGQEFLGGRVVVFRDERGVAQVVSGYCPHLGADLSRGRIVDGKVQCPFHFFEFNGEGRCVKTGYDVAPPPTARLFKYPTQERFGVIWAFNGVEPLWDLPGFSYPDDELHIIAKEYGEAPVDPYVVCCNTPDYHHFRTLHGLDWSHPDPDPRQDFRWTDHSFEYELTGKHWNDVDMAFTFGIYSASLYYQQGTLGGKWYGYLAPFKIVRPACTMTYFIIATHKGDGSPEALREAERFAEEAMDLETRFVNQDIPVLDGIHFAPGALTRKDEPLAMYLDMVRRQPRANPGRDFIN